MNKAIDKTLTRRAVEAALAGAGLKSILGIIGDLFDENARLEKALRDISDNKGCDDACGAIADTALADVDPEYEAAMAEEEGRALNDQMDRAEAEYQYEQERGAEEAQR